MGIMGAVSLPISNVRNQGDSNVRELGPGRFAVREAGGKEHVHDWPLLSYKDDSWDKPGFFSNLYPHQFAIIREFENWDIYVLDGASRCGKSFMGGGSTVAIVCQLHPYAKEVIPQPNKPLRLAVSLPRFEKFEEYLRPHIERWIPTVDGERVAKFNEAKKGVYWEFPNCHPFWGSQIFVKSGGQDIYSFGESSEFHFWWADEPLKEEWLKAAYGRTLTAKPRGGLLLTMSWIEDHPWLWNEWILAAREKTKPIFEVGDVPMSANKSIDEKRIDRAATIWSGRELIVRIKGAYVPMGSNPALNLEHLRKAFERATTGIRMRVLKDTAHNPTKYTVTPDDTSELEVWEQYDPLEDYMVAVDCSEAVGEDETVFSVWRARDAVQVAEWASSTMDVVLAAKELEKLASYYGGARVAIMQRGGGRQMIACLQHEGYTKIYHDPKTNKPGYFESKEAKDLWLPEIKTLQLHDQWRIRSRKAIQQGLTYIRNDKGDLTHQRGCHDDRLVAAILGTLLSNYKGDLKFKQKFEPGSLRDRLLQQGVGNKPAEFKILRFQ